jgi:glucosamine--fructose-6-phosphate aminotransferase (isomerizing)
MTKKGSNTYQEIISQPEVWRKTLDQFTNINVKDWPNGQDFDQLIFSGCGSTYYQSIWAARAVQELKQWVSRPLPASELLIAPKNWYLEGKKNLFVAISRSGTTSETVAALKEFNKLDQGDAFSITCYPDSDLPALTNNSICVHHAQEVSIAQTRSFTNMMLGVSFFAERVVSDGLPDKLSGQLEELFESYGGMMADLGKDKSIDRLFFLGSGPRYGLACEAMLKMKEMSISYSEAYHFMEFRHGPMSMIDQSSLVIGLLNKNEPKLELDVLKDMKDLGARVVAIGLSDHLKTHQWIDYAIPIDFAGLGIYGDVLYLPLLQLMAYERSMAKGLDPDNPTNLTSVVFVDV